MYAGTSTKAAYSREVSSRCSSSKLCGAGVAAAKIAMKRQRKVEMRSAENMMSVGGCGIRLEQVRVPFDERKR